MDNNTGSFQLEVTRIGTYYYGHDKVKANEPGQYRHEFVAENLSGKKVFIVFDGVMTDTKVMINGQLAGPVHQGSFYRFKYDIKHYPDYNFITKTVATGQEVLFTTEFMVALYMTASRRRIE